MKFGKLFLCVIASAALLAGCKEEEPGTTGTPSIQVTPTTVEEFAVTGGAAAEVSLTSNRDWKVTEKPEWITVSPEAGSASEAAQTIQIKASDNKSVARSGKIVFSAGVVYDFVNVSQAGSDAVVYTTVADVRKQATEKTKEGGLLGQNILVKVVVISDSQLKNYALTESMAMVQDETAGVQLDFDGKNTYSIGDELVIDLSGAHYEYYSNLLQVSADAEKTTVLNKGVEVTPKEITMEELLTGDYESQYVAVKDVQVAAGDLSKTLASDSDRTSITIEDASGETFVISHAAGAASSLVEKQVPQGSGILKGIASVYGAKIQMVLAKVTDVDGMNGERFSAEVLFPWTLGSNASTDNATVNGAETKVLKLGTSKKPGDATIAVPAGTKSFTFYAVSWKGAPSDLTFSGIDGISPATVSPAANDGATANPPYTITVSDSDKYTVSFSSALGEAAVITVTSTKRNILWDFNFQK